MADVDTAKVKTKGNANHTRRSYTFPHLSSKPDQSFSGCALPGLLL